MLLSCLATLAMAAQKTISGKVTGVDGKGIPFISVTVRTTRMVALQMQLVLTVSALIYAPAIMYWNFQASVLKQKSKHCR